jgi:hypothetical protein
VAISHDPRPCSLTAFGMTAEQLGDDYLFSSVPTYFSSSLAHTAQ